MTETLSDVLSDLSEFSVYMGDCEDETRFDQLISKAYSLIEELPDADEIPDCENCERIDLDNPPEPNYIP